ncbi:MAG TPA: hypothetical protein VKU36_01025 [Candidatus Babeliales bacterium]|jgi:hypothetical protein|nr:hypothetical protein [Candidatus Babeliales bacterium]
MNIKNMLSTITLISFIATGINASQNYEETSSVAKHCWKGKCFLAHSYKQSNGADVYLSTRTYDLNGCCTTIVIKNKEQNISIISERELPINKELHNHFLTECSYPKKFYVLEEKADDDATDYSRVDCDAFEDMVRRYHNK